jgi:hypothetical protein
MSVRYSYLGPIAQVATINAISKHPRQEVWTGGIGLTSRIGSGKVTTRRISEALEPKRLEPYFVQSDLTARMRCIDGRILAGYEDDLALQHRPLGPQVPGGTAMAALAVRVLHADKISDSVSFSKDIHSVVMQFREKGMGFGGHIDDIDHPHGDTGCGAIDNTPLILQRIASPVAQQQLRGLTSILLGNRYDNMTLDTIIGRIINLESISNHYFMVDRKTGRYEYKQAVVDELRSITSAAGDPIARLVGPHHEVGLVVNMVRGTTFDCDRFSADNKHQLQLFNFDFWSSQHGASVLYPVNNDITYAEAKRNLRMQHEYMTCRILLAIATTMVLTDGSIKLIIRTQK